MYTNRGSLQGEIEMKHNTFDYRAEISKLLVGRNKEEIITLIAEFISSKDLEKELLEFLILKFPKDKQSNVIKKKIDRNEENKFLKDLKEYEKDCIALSYAEEADSEDKRNAYHNGDYYLEEFESDFFEENNGVYLFYDYKKLSDKYFKQGKFRIAKKGYETLIKIYKLDGNPHNLFVDDEEFEDATLSSMGNVRLDELNKKYKECTSKISKKIKGDKK